MWITLKDKEGAETGFFSTSSSVILSLTKISLFFLPLSGERENEMKNDYIEPRLTKWLEEVFCEVIDNGHPETRRGKWLTEK